MPPEPFLIFLQRTGPIHYCRSKTHVSGSFRLQNHLLFSSNDTSFRSGSGAATKWRETIQNLSVRPIVVDWACLLQKKQETVLEAQTRALNVPRYRFLQRVKCGYEMAWNHPKHELWTKIVDWACSL